MENQIPSKSIKIPAAEPYFDLGHYHRQISTQNEDAQQWFNRGLILTYGFNHEEATFCFKQTILHDPDCAMGYWGLAYALGPNYNKPWDFYDAEELGDTVTRTHDAVLRARDCAMRNTSEVEKSLAEAIVARYPDGKPAEDMSIWNLTYAEAMRTVYQRFPDDLDVATLCADALMNLKPWALWDIKTKAPAPDAPTLEVQRVLEHAFQLKGGEDHPGLLHLHIHFWEMSPHPETALPLADRLRGLVPDAGHLQHMPSHLDVLCGDYRRAIASNRDASVADERFVAKRGALNFFTLYRCHDYHFGVYAAMLAGQYKPAIDIASQLEAAVSEDLLRVKSPPMADWLESFTSVKLHVLVRFGQWKNILQLEPPQDETLYCVTTAILLYAKGIASAVLKDIKAAEKFRQQFQGAKVKVPESRTLFNNKSIDILAIAEAMLNGEIEYRKGNFSHAFGHLERAVHLDDDLPYDEPWGWMQPARHALGALLLEQGHVEKAAEVYAADLGMNDTLPRQMQHLNNVWALHGLHECLVKLGRNAEAEILAPQVKLALAYADVRINASCFCRLETGK